MKIIRQREYVEIEGCAPLRRRLPARMGRFYESGVAAKWCSVRPRAPFTSVEADAKAMFGH